MTHAEILADLAHQVASSYRKDERTEQMNIHEVLEYGPIVAHNEELDILITVNGAYFNVWVGADFTSTPSKGRQWTNTEAYDVVSRIRMLNEAKIDPMNPLAGVPFWYVVEAGESLLAEINQEGDEEK